MSLENDLISVLQDHDYLVFRSDDEALQWVVDEFGYVPLDHEAEADDSYRFHMDNHTGPYRWCESPHRA